MKPINSVISGLVSRAQEDANSTGPQHGGRGAGQARKPISSGDRSKPTGMAGILAERRRQASIQDDVSAGGWILSEDDGLSGVWINPREPGDGSTSGSVSNDPAPAGQVRGMGGGTSRGNGPPW